MSSLSSTKNRTQVKFLKTIAKQVVFRIIDHLHKTKLTQFA